MRSYVLLYFIISATCTNSVSAQAKDTGSARILAVARELMSVSKNCALITYSTSGYPRARTMDPFAPDSSMVIWLATNPRSSKVSEIRKNKKVALYYYDPTSPGYVSIRGHAELIDNQEAKQRFWKEGWDSFYKNRTTDYLLIKVTPIEVEVASYRDNLLGEEKTWKAPAVKMKLKS